MKNSKSKISVFFASFAVCLVLSGCGRKAEPQEVIVATWNIKWFPSGVPQPQETEYEGRVIATVARLVREYQPDILCVQEIRDTTALTQMVHQTGLPLHVAACSAFPQALEGIPQQQVAIVTRYPVLESGAERWTTFGFVDPPRGFAYAVLDAPMGKIAVFTLHLKSNFIPREAEDPDRINRLNRMKRELASQQLRERIHALMHRDTDPIRHVILAGDFNSSLWDERWQDETTLSSLLDFGFSCVLSALPPEERHTMDETRFYPATTFDYIFTLGFPSATARVLPRRWVSDHRTVIARLKEEPM